MEEKFVITEITQVIMVGKDEYTDGITGFAHNLKVNELIFHFSGQATVRFNGMTLETKPGTVRFLPQGEVTEYSVHRHERGECIDVFFKTDRPISAKAFVKSVSRLEQVGALFKRLFAIWTSKQGGYYFESVSLLYKIFSELQKDVSTPNRYLQKLAPAVEIIHSDFLSSELYLSTLAAACHMGESYFQKLFRKVYGVSPVKYLIRLKINHACELLRLERYTVTQIAQLCGFSDVYYFSRQFKSYMGITPTAFAEKYKSSK